MGFSRLLFQGLRVTGIFLLSVSQFVQELNDSHVQKERPLFASVVAQVVQYNVPTEPLNEWINVYLFSALISAKKVGILLT